VGRGEDCRRKPLPGTALSSPPQADGLRTRVRLIAPVFTCRQGGLAERPRRLFLTSNASRPEFATVAKRAESSELRQRLPDLNPSPTGCSLATWASGKTGTAIGLAGIS